jgi:hypothetical protein
MESAPAGNVVVEKVAIPLEFNEPVPRLVVPLSKVTVPVGVFVADCAVTVAVNVTFCPTGPDVGLAVSAVAVAGSVEPGQRNTVIENGGSE